MYWVTCIPTHPHRQGFGGRQSGTYCGRGLERHTRDARKHLSRLPCQLTGEFPRVVREGIELLLPGEDEYVATTIGGHLLHQHQLGEPTEAPLEGETRHRQGGQFK